jgi:hypothetical protein
VWAICDSTGIPTDLLGDYDPLPGFWDYLSDLDQSEATLAEVSEGFEDDLSGVDPDDAYQVEHLTDAEILETFGNLYPDYTQDWPEQRAYYPAIETRTKTTPFSDFEEKISFTPY